MVVNINNEKLASFDDRLEQIKINFHSEMEHIYRETKKLKYNPAYFRRMVCDKGGYEATRQLINTDKPSEGFTTLWELKRLDLSVEAHVIKREYSEIFTDYERLICIERLKDYGHEFN